VPTRLLCNPRVAACSHIRRDGKMFTVLRVCAKAGETSNDRSVSVMRMSVLAMVHAVPPVLDLHRRNVCDQWTGTVFVSFRANLWFNFARSN
jgi:hypothetical protein